MNTFDFYVVKAFGGKLALRPLVKLAGGTIETRRVGYKTYGPRSFPVWEHSLSLGYVDVSGKKKEEIDGEIEAIVQKFSGKSGARILAIYVARD